MSLTYLIRLNVLMTNNANRSTNHLDVGCYTDPPGKYGNRDDAEIASYANAYRVGFSTGNDADIRLSDLACV